jgi:hypothetical protein
MATSAANFASSNSWASSPTLSGKIAIENGKERFIGKERCSVCMKLRMEEGGRYPDVDLRSVVVDLDGMSYILGSGESGYSLPYWEVASIEKPRVSRETV